MTSGRTERLIVFTRYPEPGRTKTRLIPALGPRAAAETQTEMTRHVLGRSDAWLDGGPKEQEVRFEGGDAGLMAARFGRRAYVPQGRGGLGERMARAFTDAFDAGCARVVVIGGDCPGIDADLLRRAFERLRDHDVALGPATDGGYYLIGLRVMTRALFGDLPWGSAAVLERTLALAREAGLSVALLDELPDVDLPEDLGVWRAAQRAQAPPGRVSVIVPALNEAERIGEALARAREGENVETVVVDGGSADDTAETAAEAGARVFHGPRGRARQMNLGAAVAGGEFYCFLHADTRLPEGFARHVRDTLAPRSVAGGAFAFRLDHDSPALRVVEWVVNRRSRRFQMPYGDQALFIRESTFHELRGFPEAPIMEDYAFVRRLRRRGRIAIAPAAVVTSARRWRRRGVLRTTLLNQAIIIAYHLGVPPRVLARWCGRPEAGA